MELVKDIDSYNYILEKYTLKDTLTNNYLMAEQVSLLIENKNLTFLEGTKNLFFFVEQLNAIQILLTKIRILLLLGTILEMLIRKLKILNKQFGHTTIAS